MSQYYGSAFLKAVDRGEAGKVKRLLHWGINPHVRDPETGYSALGIAAARGYLEVVNVLLNNGADPNFRERGNNTALHFATRNDHLEVVERLLAAGARVDIRNNLGHTPLLSDLHAEPSDSVILALLSGGADPDRREPGGENLLTRASRIGDTETLKILLERGADPNDTFILKEVPSHYSYLMQASGSGHLEAVCILLSHGANPLLRNQAQGRAVDEAKQRLKNYDKYVRLIKYYNELEPGYKKHVRFEKLEPSSRQEFKKIIKVLKTSQTIYQNEDYSSSERLKKIRRKIEPLCPPGTIIEASPMTEESEPKP